MASTATNKQPLLIDRVLHEVKDLAGATVPASSGVSIAGTNTAKVIVDSSSLDGAILEDIYIIARDISTGYKVNLYISTAIDYLRAQEGIYVGTITGGTAVGTVTRFDAMPNILAPVPATGNTAQLKALYVPKGKVLWAAAEQQTSSDLAPNAPILGAQGGWY